MQVHGASSSEEIEQLVKLLSAMPGLGPRSGRRIVLYLMQHKERMLAPLITALERVSSALVSCHVCGALDTCDPCHICRDPDRDRSIICVVESIVDLWALERARAVDGRYHVLGGALSPLDGIGPDDLRIGELVSRAGSAEVREVVLAMNATIEGQTTAHYVTDALSKSGVAVSRLAQGVPVGGELDYLDDGTLAAAVKSRTPF